MQKDILQKADRCLARNRLRRIWKKVVSVLSCIVLFWTSYMLILPAITMGNTTYCGFEIHQHSLECYEKMLICGQEETEATARTHTEDSIAREQGIICENENPEHQHTEECYESVLMCGMEEHTHELSCYSNPEADVESPEIWLQSVSGVELTGNWRTDLVAVAESQLDYAESSQNYVVDEKEAKKGYTRYGAWYGDEFVYEDWNSLFVMFCLDYAEIPTEAMPRFMDCQEWIESLNDGYYAAVSDYEPVAGDLVFFDIDKDGQADRVGIVTKASKELSESDLTGIETIQGDTEDKVQSVEYIVNEDETILGYAALTENPGEDSGEVSSEDNVEQTTCTYEGEDYTITVTYGPEAEIPEAAKLIASEYAKDSEHYQERYAQAAKLYGWEEDRSDSIRLFNIGFYVDDKEIEPAAGVEVTITYNKQEKAANYKIIHFGGETEEPKTESTYENGQQNIDFTLDHFSDIMLVALAASDLNGQTFALFSPANLRVMTAVSTKLSGKLDAAEVGYYFNPNGDIFIYPTTTEGQESPNYELWTFESVGASANAYYITTTVDGQPKYLTIDGENVTVENQKTDEAERAEKQVITVTEGTGDYAGQVRLTNAAGIAVNKYGGQNIYKEYFGGYNAGHLNDVNDYFYLAKQGEPAQIGTVKGVTPNGTVINVFDYWVTERTTPGGDFEEAVDLSRGINNGHVLKFTKGNVEGSLTNTWTGSIEPRKGLVEKTLGDDGYPRLTQYAADNSGTADNIPESLAYLFEPEESAAYKQTFRNVGGLLQIDEMGYYYYTSQKNFAQLDEATKQFTLYNTWGVKKGGEGPDKTDGQFFPFNKFSDSQNHDSKSSEINHYFGMTMKSRFVQRHGGHTTAKRNIPTVFDFSGDDDVWVFIDGVLVGDLGGIHDRASLAIDFSTGNVSINGNVVRTLKQAFVEAGVETATDEWNGNTFADNTYHTLKFYYLERGNYDSNMSLKYNLTAVPETSIFKTDQYGVPLKNVEFKVYKANENWQITDENPVYTGKTDTENGEMVFKDEDEKPYTLRELREIFGDYCILKETKAPPGHRLVDTEVRLRISDKALWCANTYESGVWAMVTLQISAPAELQLVNGTTKTFYGEDSSEKPNGTLFGVVAKRVGTGGLSKQESWALVSGDSKGGYVVHEAKTNEQFVQAAIDIAKEKGSVFTMTPSGAMELMMEDLPGHVTEYYYMLPAAEREEKAEFTTAYYWTEADSIDGANVNNTFRVNSDAEAPHAFDRTFGAKIEVPNLCNRLLVQKFDEGGKLINGAIFALFKADENGSYIAEDGTKVTLEEGKYTTEVHFNANNDTESYAVIRTDDGKTIKSVEQRRTNSVVLAGTDGTCVFGIRQKVLDEGCYYLQEVEAPPGYQINPTPVMVRVTDEAIYANAGKAKDGVQVARGPGYIASTLHKAASAGDVDNTLTWIYQKLRVSSESTSFKDLSPSGRLTWDYAKDADGKELASYLIYTREAQHLGEKRFLANYRVDEENDRPAMAGTVRTHIQQIVTDVGWSYNEIYQDYEYGINKVKENGKNANYTDLRAEGDISDLFSRSVYVQVTDEKSSNLEISKTVAGIIEDSSTSDVFTFTITVEGAAGEYEYAIYSSSDSERKTPVGTGKISSGGTINLKNGQAAVITGLPVGAKYTVTETSADGYITSYRIDGADSVTGNTAHGTLNWKEGVDGAHISTVAFTNTRPLDLTLNKYVTGTTTPLSGAKFVLHTTGETKAYYKIENGQVSWVSLDSQNTLQNLALTTDANGRIDFEKLLDGEYSLKEIAAPDGCYLLEKEITFTVSGGKVAIGPANNYTENTVTVYNSTGYELPKSGGSGTKLYTIGGLLLIAGAGSLLLYGNKKRRTDIKEKSM